jgi:hypothetical protein
VQWQLSEENKLTKSEEDKNELTLCDTNQEEGEKEKEVVPKDI